MVNLCAPAIIYIIFSLAQVIIDTFKGLYNTAMVKIIIMIMITTLLQILCDRGLNIVSWIIVFIPFILMTVVVSIVLYIFGLNATTGSIDYSCNSKNKDGRIRHNDNATNISSCWKNITKDKQGNIIIYSPYYDSKRNPVYYKSPNIVVPRPELLDDDNHPNKIQYNEENNYEKNDHTRHQRGHYYSSSHMFQ
jgi:hypothetical protein